MASIDEKKRTLPAAALLRHASFVSLPVLDGDRALKFWRDIVGLPVESDSTMDSYRWISLKIGSSATLLHLSIVEEMPPKSMKPAMSLFAADVPAVVDALCIHNVEIVAKPGPAPWNDKTIWATFYDSEGNLIMLQDK